MNRPREMATPNGGWHGLVDSRPPYSAGGRTPSQCCLLGECKENASWSTPAMVACFENTHESPTAGPPLDTLETGARSLASGSSTPICAEPASARNRIERSSFSPVGRPRIGHRSILVKSDRRCRVTRSRTTSGPRHDEFGFGLLRPFKPEGRRSAACRPTSLFSVP